MGVFRQFPYSNFHEMNMDEMIKIIKNMLEEWAQYHAEWDAWKNQMNDDWSNYQEVMNEAWQNMQNFINNYFDNLDVQEEINNKIVSMVASGEFASIVAPYIPPRVTEWLTAHITQPEGVVIDTSLTVAGACADAKATGDAIKNVDDDLSEVIGLITDTYTIIGDSYITNSGNIVSAEGFNYSSPIQVNAGDIVKITAGGYSNNVAMISTCASDGSNINVVAEGTQSDPKEYKYQVINDGYVCFSWKVSDGIEIRHETKISNTALYNDIVNTRDAIGIINDTFNSIQGSYITNSGNITNANGFCYSSPIPVSKGDFLKLYAGGYSNNVAMISTCASDGSNIRVVAQGTQSESKLYTYEVVNDGYICLSWNAKRDFRFTHETVITNTSLYNKIDNIEIALTDNLTLTFNDGYYIPRNGVKTANSSFCYTDSFYLKPCHLVIYAQGYLDNVAILSQGLSTDANVTPIIISDDSTYKRYEIDIQAEGYYLISSNKATRATAYICPQIFSEGLTLCDISVFQHFGVVGDSFASGELVYDGGYHDKYATSWGQIMARKHGTTCTNYSSGGQTTRSWLTATKGLPLVLSSDPEDIYYLTLGINDYYSLGENYIGSIDDITNDYTQNPDTFFGNYARIIEQIQAHAPHAKMVMFTVASTATVPQLYSDAIIEIAEHYNIPYIVQADDDFFKSPVYLDMEGSHPTAIGYSGMAVAFERLLNKCIVSNLAYFHNMYMYD